MRDERWEIRDEIRERWEMGDMEERREMGEMRDVRREIRYEICKNTDDR